jgi:hypothetical protein
MTLTTASTLSISDFAALVDAAHALPPLSPCQGSSSRSAASYASRSASPQYYQHQHQHQHQCRSPSPFMSPHYGLERCCGAPDLRRGSASSDMTDYYDEHEHTPEDGIIWFGRRRSLSPTRRTSVSVWEEAPGHSHTHGHNHTGHGRCNQSPSASTQRSDRDRGAPTGRPTSPWSARIVGLLRQRRRTPPPKDAKGEALQHQRRISIP